MELVCSESSPKSQNFRSHMFDHENSTSDITKGSVSWHAVQTLFEQADSDILLLLDCCAAASGALTEASSTSVTETIAACGFETWAPQPGRHSFTNTLIAVLDDWCDRPAFTAAMLHCEILNRLRHEKPERYRNTKTFEFRKSPIHVLSTNDPKARSIELAARPPPKDLPVDEITQSSSSHPETRGITISKLFETQTMETEPSRIATTSDQAELYNMTFLTKVLDSGNTSLPHVLLSLALEGDQVLNFEHWRKWLQDFPALATYATVQAVYESNSTLLILSLPVVIWDWMPEDPACTFIGYVHSKNLIANELKQRLPSEMVDEMLQDSQGMILSIGWSIILSFLSLFLYRTAACLSKQLQHSPRLKVAVGRVLRFSSLLISFLFAMSRHLAFLRLIWNSTRAIRNALVEFFVTFVAVFWAVVGVLVHLAGGRDLLKTH